MTDWTSLRQAYGSADEVPALLAEADAAGVDEGRVWDDLWCQLCHQGTVYSASYAALPSLAAMTTRGAPAGYAAPLHLAAAIISSTDGPEDAAVIRRQYADVLRELRDVAERNLGLADSEADFVWGMQALLAFEDGGVWQRHLECLHNGELSLECPSCDDALLLNLDGPQFNLVHFDDASVMPTPVVPTDPRHTDEGARILGLAEQYGYADVASKIPYLFGRATCPACGRTFQIPVALA